MMYVFRSEALTFLRRLTNVAQTGVLTWNGSKCSSFGDKNCSVRTSTSYLYARLVDRS